MNAFDNDKQKCKNFCQGRRLLMFKSCICSITKHSFKLSGPLRFLKFIQNSYLSPRRRCGQRNHFAHREGRQPIPACAQWVRRGGGTENGGEAVDLSKNCMENLTRPGHTVVRQSVHNPGALPPVLEAAIFPWTHTMQTHQRTHARSRTHSHARAAPHAHALLFLFALLQKAEFALNSTAHCAVLGKRSWI